VRKKADLRSDITGARGFSEVLISFGRARYGGWRGFADAGW
jgi:hypothetical protein